MRDIVDEVYSRWEAGRLPLSDENVVSFALGYQLVRCGSEVSFQLGQLQESKLSPDTFSPDIDVFEERLSDENDPAEQERKTTVGYEVKSFDSSTHNMSKKRIYEAIGQSWMLLNQPVDDPGGLLKYVYIAYPRPMAAFDDKWLARFEEVLQETPIGLIIVNRDGLDEKIKPEQNPFYEEYLASIVANKVATDTGLKSPIFALEKMAKRIDEEYPNRLADIQDGIRRAKENYESDNS